MAHKATFQMTHRPDFMDDVQLESDSDIQESWLSDKTSDIDADVIYLHLTDTEWANIGIRDELWGQSRLIDGRVICYGRWYENGSYQNSYRYNTPLNRMAEQTIGIAHEAAHGLYSLRGLEDLTHYHFYGYQNAADDNSQTRWQRTPTPRQAFDEVLNENEDLKFYCIRTQPLTEAWLEEVTDARHFIMQEYENLVHN